MSAYLPELTFRLADGLESLDVGRRERHARFFLAAQQADGGFAGRAAGSDLYYTSFALRGLAILGELSGEPAAATAAYLAGRLRASVPIVDFLSLVHGGFLLEATTGNDAFASARSDWTKGVEAALDALRRDDGGYAKGPEGTASSTYHSFLVVLCRQLLGAPLVAPERLAEFVLGQRREDGGFVEIRAMRRSGTNPTAAAIGLLKILDRLEQSVADEAIDFLVDMQTDEGGLRANTRIPIADLLSTFTGILTLVDLGGAHEIDARAVRRFVESLERPDGGFHGAAWDEGTDVEYTFYGLGSLALLADTTP